MTRFPEGSLDNNLGLKEGTVVTEIRLLPSCSDETKTGWNYTPRNCSFPNPRGIQTRISLSIP